MAEHIHQWKFIKLDWRRTNPGVTAGSVVGEDFSIWICICGAGKEVIHDFSKETK